MLLPALALSLTLAAPPQANLGLPALRLDALGAMANLAPPGAERAPYEVGTDALVAMGALTAGQGAVLTAASVVLSGMLIVALGQSIATGTTSAGLLLLANNLTALFEVVAGLTALGGPITASIALAYRRQQPERLALVAGIALGLLGEALGIGLGYLLANSQPGLGLGGVGGLAGLVAEIGLGGLGVTLGFQLVGAPPAPAPAPAARPGPLFPSPEGPPPQAARPAPGLELSLAF